jgi:hypothetical protein
MRVQALRQPPRAGEEAELRNRLDVLQQELDDPSQYKGKLHELRARIGMQVRFYMSFITDSAGFRGRVSHGAVQSSTK